MLHRDAQWFPRTQNGIRADCSDVLEANGSPPTDTLGWLLVMLTPMTFDDPDNGDIPMIDLSQSAQLHSVSNGAFALDDETTAIFAGMGPPPLPACTGIEAPSTTIMGPDGIPFAVLGSGSRWP